MRILRHIPKKSYDDSILYPALQCWNPVTKIVTFAAQVRNKRVLCSIESNDLRIKYHIFKDNPLKILSDNRNEIECAATKLIRREAYEKDGTIVIRYKDL